ncbi:mediator complex subunit MED14 [Teladorsagia circumcincta]|uniref:Mediator of RNA polymerase II transcription subunit 14 n=1 Tax=Teladorsagia circumcincta TaxID=45464 RepID=A0A2G9V3N2_TELCI|nr:mediator complex subunit MED14 [Teladorsagia circumcincta]
MLYKGCTRKALMDCEMIALSSILRASFKGTDHHDYKLLFTKFLIVPMDDGDHSKPALPVVPDKCGPPTISLNYLLDFAIQQIYHEITVLSELLPKKLDGDRKISLVQFAHSTRMLFVKLLAVVKWVKSSKKFESCAAICYLLDQQSQYFVETADRLVTISREELVMARLPAFQVTAAVDVLTQGTYQHLPTIIKDRFVLKPKISSVDEANVLLRLNQLILTVPGEFEVNLTVLGEREQTPWTLLNIKMLVEDYEIGYGAQLVHPLQLHMLHNVLQSRMDVAKNPINEAYTFLHTFAQSLQLDVLFCQASQLAAGRLRNKIVIEKYDPKERILSIGYWVQRIAKRMIGNVRLVPQYRVTIFGDAGDDTSLKVRHYPIAPDLGQLDDRTGRLSIDRLLSETLVVRCRERLLRIRKRLKAAKPLSIVLYAEFLPGSASELKELETALYDGQSIDSLRKRIDRLKVLLMIERYRRSVSTLQVRIINENQMAPFFKKVAVITFVSNENLTVKMNLYLLCTLDDKVQMMELNKEKQLISAPIDGVVDIEAKTFGQSEYDDVWTLKEKHSRVEPSMVRQLTTAVAAVDDRISFMRVCEELDKKRIGYRSVEEEPHTGVWVHEQTGISVGGPVDTIATSIIERLTRYSHIYDTVNRFAKAYDAHYNKFCNVQAYTFHKLVIAYGRERDQQLIVSFRPRNASNDRFNLNFGQSCKVLAQLFNNDIPYPLTLKFHLMPINEVTLRLTYGHIHLEFIMLSGDTVAIRDSSRNNPRCAGLHQFFHLLSNGTSKSCKENEPRFLHSSSPIQPASLPPNIVDASPAGLSLSASLSVPPNSDAAAVSPAMLAGTNLMRAPLDDYLSALCFIKKLALAFEAHKRNQSAGRFPFSEMRCGLDFVRISIPVAVPPQTQRTDASAPQTPQQIGGIVSFNFHLDANTLTLKLNVEYSRNSPPPNDIATLERYFELVVCRLNNELAVFSFINLCRMVANGAVSGIAHVMNAQMDPSPSTYWNVSIQLVCLARDQANASARRYQFGTVFDANNVNALLLICFRPSRATSPRTNEKHLLRIVYNMQTNTVKQHGSEDEALSSILSACSQEAARTGECPLWPAIRQCLDKVSSANVAGMPASVGYMPGSVGGPVSVGPVGSVGMGHNPGSIANPGSNT